MAVGERRTNLSFAIAGFAVAVFLMGVWLSLAGSYPIIPGPVAHEQGSIAGLFLIGGFGYLALFVLVRSRGWVWSRRSSSA